MDSSFKGLFTSNVAASQKPEWTHLQATETTPSSQFVYLAILFSSPQRSFLYQGELISRSPPYFHLEYDSRRALTRLAQGLE